MHFVQLGSGGWAAAVDEEGNTGRRHRGRVELRVETKQLGVKGGRCRCSRRERDEHRQLRDRTSDRVEETDVCIRCGHGQHSRRVEYATRVDALPQTRSHSRVSGASSATFTCYVAPALFCCDFPMCSLDVLCVQLVSAMRMEWYSTPVIGSRGCTTRTE